MSSELPMDQQRLIQWQRDNMSWTDQMFHGVLRIRAETRAANHGRTPPPMVLRIRRAYRYLLHRKFDRPIAVALMRFLARHAPLPPSEPPPRT